MIERYTQGKITWIDLSNPTADEVQEVATECSLTPTLTDDLTVPVPRSRAVASGKAVKLILDFPVVKRTDIDHPHEVKFIVTKTHLITARYEDMEAFDRFKREFEVLTTLKKPGKGITGAHLFFALMNVLYEVSASKLDYMESRIADVEAEMLNQREKQMVFEISKISKRLIVFRQTLRAHDDVFREAKELFDTTFSSSFDTELDHVHNHSFYILRRTTVLFETLDDLRETNNALLTTKQNEIMKTLTIMAFITFPLTLMTSMFGMNTQSAPIVGQVGDFWIILGMMSVATVVFFTYFKYKRWI